MRGAARLGDFSTGHGPYPPRPNNSASSNVLINGVGAHCVGDSWHPHCYNKSCHGGVTVGGSSSVMVNGVPLARTGDPISCGESIASGSSNVMVGG